MESENNLRIIRNAFFLYLRTFIVLILSLYISRVVLDVIGIIDFGIYNVVAGLIIMFSFLNNSMSTSCQRFFSYSIGEKDFKSLNIIYSQTVIIHFVISIIIVILVEIIGLWLFYNKLIIPFERRSAALIVFHISVFGLFISTMRVPLNALIIALEKMKFFGIISIIEVTLKLIVIISIQFIIGDKLILYSIGLTLNLIVLYVIYYVYIKKQTKNISFLLFLDKKKAKEIMSFSSWNLFGSLSVVFKDQGNNLLMNIFFGPLINASRGISYQISGAIFGFVSNIFMAVNPQIIKSYATGNLSYMHKLIFIGSRISFFLLLIISVPIFFNTNGILLFWLNKVPEYSVIFTKLILVILLINSIANPLVVAAQANGNIKKYQTTVGLLLLTILPLTYICYKLNLNPEYSYYVTMFVSAIAFIIRLFFLKKMINLNLNEYFRKVLFPIIKVISVSFIVYYIYIYNFRDLSLGMFFNIMIDSLICLIIIIFFGLSFEDKKFIKNKIKLKIK